MRNETSKNENSVNINSLKSKTDAKNRPETTNPSEQKKTAVNPTKTESINSAISDKGLEEKKKQVEAQDNKRIQELREEHGFKQPKMPEPKIKKSETQTYAEENLGQFENVEIKKISELSCWNKISDFIGSKEMVGIDNIETIIASGGKQWESIFGSNDSKSSHKPMTIILKKEIFDNENISDEDASWLVHEVGHIKFYQDLGDKLDEYMKEYHKKGEYTDSEMEKFAFELQFEYLKSKGKTKDECEDVVKKYLDKSFGGDDKIEEAEKEAKAKEYKQMTNFLDNVFEVNTDIPRSVENGMQEEKKRKILAERRLEIDRIVDFAGKGIEPKIKETLLGLNLLGYNTTQSCEGHTGPEQYSKPWIQIGVPNEPEYRFAGQKNIFAKVAEEFNITPEDVRRRESEEAWRKAMNESAKTRESPEYTQWRITNQELMGKLSNLLDEFYAQRQVDPAIRLYIVENPSGSFEIHNGLKDYPELPEDVTEEDKKEISGKLSQCQAEMEAFAIFLIDKFITK